jgi:hypothetical protein
MLRVFIAAASGATAIDYGFIDYGFISVGISLGPVRRERAAFAAAYASAR